MSKRKPAAKRPVRAPVVRRSAVPRVFGAVTVEQTKKGWWIVSSGSHEFSLKLPSAERAAKWMKDFLAGPTEEKR